MNAQNIQIGWWLDYFDHPVRISRIYHHPDRYDVEISSTAGIQPARPVMAQNLGPILLTERVILKAGFSQLQPRIFSKNVTSSISLECKQTDNFLWTITEITILQFGSIHRHLLPYRTKFLHEFQVFYYNRYHIPLDFDPT